MYNIPKVCFCGSVGLFKGPDGENTLCKADYERYENIARTISNDYANQLFTMQRPTESRQPINAIFDPQNSSPPRLNLSTNLMATDSAALEKFINPHSFNQTSGSSQSSSEPFTEADLGLLATILAPSNPSENFNSPQPSESNREAPFFSPPFSNDSSATRSTVYTDCFNTIQNSIQNMFPSLPTNLMNQQPSTHLTSSHTITTASQNLYQPPAHETVPNPNQDITFVRINPSSFKPLRIEYQFVCANCGTQNTPQWRRSTNPPHLHLCNACGLQEKKKGKKLN